MVATVHQAPIPSHFPHGGQPQQFLSGNFQSGGGHFISAPTSVDKASGMAPFFGQPSREDTSASRQVHSTHGFIQDVYNLPDALSGTNGYMMSVVIRAITMIDMWQVQEMLPYKRHTGSLTVQWDEWVFNDHILDRTPEQSTSRMLTSSFQGFSEKLIRVGKALMLEHGFWRTPMGQQNWAMNIIQLVNATTETACYGAMVAVLCAKPYIDPHERFRQMGQRNSIERIVQIICDEAANYCAVQKGNRQFEKVIAAAKAVFENRNHHKPDYCVVPQHTQPMLREREVEQVAYYNGVGETNVTVAQKTMMTTRESREFIVNTNQEAVDPCYQPVRTASFHHMSSGLVLKSLKDSQQFRTFMCNTKIFSQPHAEFREIDFDQAFHHTGLYSNPKAGISEWTQLGRAFLGKYETVTRICRKAGIEQAVVQKLQSMEGRRWDYFRAIFAEPYKKWLAMDNETTDVGQRVQTVTGFVDPSSRSTYMSSQSRTGAQAAGAPSSESDLPGDIKSMFSLIAIDDKDASLIGLDFDGNLCLPNVSTGTARETRDYIFPYNDAWMVFSVASRHLVLFSFDAGGSGDLRPVRPAALVGNRVIDQKKWARVLLSVVVSMFVAIVEEYLKAGGYGGSDTDSNDLSLQDRALSRLQRWMQSSVANWSEYGTSELSLFDLFRNPLSSVDVDMMRRLPGQNRSIDFKQTLGCIQEICRGDSDQSRRRAFTTGVQSFISGLVQDNLLLSTTMYTVNVSDSEMEAIKKAALAAAASVANETSDTHAKARYSKRWGHLSSAVKKLKQSRGHTNNNWLANIMTIAIRFARLDVAIQFLTDVVNDKADQVFKSIEMDSVGALFEDPTGKGPKVIKEPYVRAIGKYDQISLQKLRLGSASKRCVLSDGMTKQLLQHARFVPVTSNLLNAIQLPSSGGGRTLFSGLTEGDLNDLGDVSDSWLQQLASSQGVPSARDVLCAVLHANGSTMFRDVNLIVSRYLQQRLVGSVSPRDTLAAYLTLILLGSSLVNGPGLSALTQKLTLAELKSSVDTLLLPLEEDDAYSKYHASWSTAGLVNSDGVSDSSATVGVISSLIEKSLDPLTRVRNDASVPQSVALASNSNDTFAQRQAWKPKDISSIEWQKLLNVIPLKDDAWARFFLGTDIPMPIGLIGWKLQKEYDLGTGFVMDAYGAAGYTYFGNSDFQLGDDIGQKVHVAHFTLYLKSMVQFSKLIVYMRNIVSRGYIGGDGVSMWDALNDTHVADFHKRDGVRCDIIYAPVLANWSPPHIVMDVTGEFPSSLNPSADAQDATSYESAKLICDHWKIGHRTEMSRLRSPSYHESIVQTSFGSSITPTVALREGQLYYNHREEGFSNKTTDHTHWGPNLGPHTAHVRAGRGGYIPMESNMCG